MRIVFLELNNLLSGHIYGKDNLRMITVSIQLGQDCAA